MVAAAAEDPIVATQILGPASAALAEIVAAVAIALGFEKNDLPVATAGGLLLGAPSLAESFQAHLAARGFSPRFERVSEPALGAVILARCALDEPYS